MELHRFAWPAAFVAITGIGYAYLTRPDPQTTVVFKDTGPTVVKGIRGLSKLETAALRVEKVIDVRDKQSFHGLVDANDSLVFVARGEVTLGVDLSRLAVDDTKFDEQTKTAYVTLPAPEILSSRFDEMHSYVHSRSTDLLAKRNEELEALARRKAIAEFEASAHEPSAVELAKSQAEKQLRAFAKGWGASDVVVTWRSDSVASNAPSRINGADGQLGTP